MASLRVRLYTFWKLAWHNTRIDAFAGPVCRFGRFKLLAVRQVYEHCEHLWVFRAVARQYLAQNVDEGLSI